MKLCVIFSDALQRKLDLSSVDSRQPWTLKPQVEGHTPWNKGKLRAGDLARQSLEAWIDRLLLGHTKLESTVRYLGIEVDDALELAEQSEV